jgi:membrane fusion protein (multidrug efflux system)
MEPTMTETNLPAESPAEASSTAAAEAPNRGRLVLVILLAALVVGVGAMYFHYRNRVSTDDAQVDGHLVPISCKVYGSVQQVLVDDNQPVQAGDLLVQLDPRDLQSKVDQAVAALGQTLAEVQGAKADDDKAKVALEQARSSDLQVAQANLDARKATHDKAAADLQRAKPLADRQEISAQEFDTYRTQAQVADSDLQAAQRHLASVRQEAEIRASSLIAQAAKIGQANAAVAAAKANLDALKLQLSYTRITAPVAGVVTRKTVELGQIIQPGQGLLTLVPLEATWITANFKETQLAKVHPGMRAEVTIDMNDQVLRGTVDSVAGSTGSRLSLLPPENAVGNFVKVVQRIPVKIVLDPQDAQKVVLRPGMNVDATILTK